MPRTAREIISTIPRSYEEVLERVVDELIEAGYTSESFWDEFCSSHQIRDPRPMPDWAVRLVLPDYIWLGLQNAFRDQENKLRRSKRRGSLLKV